MKRKVTAGIAKPVVIDVSDWCALCDALGVDGKTRNVYHLIRRIKMLREISYIAQDARSLLSDLVGCWSM